MQVPNCQQTRATPISLRMGCKFLSRWSLNYVNCILSLSPIKEIREQENIIIFVRMLWFLQVIKLNNFSFRYLESSVYFLMTVVLLVLSGDPW